MAKKDKRPVYPEADLELYKSQHQSVVSSSISWLFSAMHLERATEVLLAQSKLDFDARTRQKPGDPCDVSIDSVAKMLAGMTIENLLKGVIAIKQSVIKENGEMEAGVKSHDLLDLAEKSKIDVDLKTREMLERLEDAIVWSGRYPAPLNHKDSVPRLWGEHEIYQWSIVRSSDFDLWRKLVTRLRQIIEDNHKSINERKKD
ncbi:MAG: hypothetical protein JNM63_00205 [Spirochaetia bacterium]|nr:hypothetical protein [Spirochaetia bacterium]